MTEAIDRLRQVQEILDDYFWLPTLDAHKTYQRFEDDSPKGTLCVQFSRDGDAWLQIVATPDPDDMSFSQRFRMPDVGGGQSPRVRNALLILAEAIRLDNKDRPQQRG